MNWTKTFASEGLGYRNTNTDRTLFRNTEIYSDRNTEIYSDRNTEIYSDRQSDDRDMTGDRPRGKGLGWRQQFDQTNTNTER